MHKIEGKVWAGPVELERVEFSSDNGITWRVANMQEKNGPFGWASWSINWEAVEGEASVLCCRGFDKEGRSQDKLGTEMFNYGSFGCLQPQQVYVKVVPASALEPGSKIDLTPEQKAAKDSLLEESGLAPVFVKALYQAPGS